MADDDLPDDFLDGKSILITSVQKLFNGKTKFGLNGKSIDVSYFLLDDAHACVDAIRSACSIKVKKDDPVYRDLVDLFAEALQAQEQARTWNCVKAHLALCFQSRTGNGGNVRPR